jgi:hypothetical protein
LLLILTPGRRRAESSPFFKDFPFMSKKILWAALFLFSLFLGTIWWSNLQINGAEKKTPPPLVVDKSAPLRLDDSVSTNDGRPVADNSACQVCHMNYAEELLAARHAKANVGCVNCHGDSYAHRNDENNTTPPEKIYSSEKVDSLCQQCHEQKHNAPAKKVVERWMSLEPIKKNPQALICTDCHGKHRLSVRTVRWDKNTGKLLSTNKK